MPSTLKKRRLLELDLLRGLFIVIIIIDHLQFWPSPLSFLTGQGRLWASAAEGFFLISGLLIGYIRGHKNKHIPLTKVSLGLLKRAAILYTWGVGITFLIVLFSIWVGGTAVHPLLPKMPSSTDLQSPLHLTVSILSTNYFSDWIYFLKLYAIMLIATPLFLWLLRQNKEWLIIILIGGVFAWGMFNGEAALQWQLLFFGAALIGYHLETIAAWFASHKKIKIAGTASVFFLTLCTMMLSYFFVLGWDKVENPNWDLMDVQTYLNIRANIDPWFSNSPMALGRVGLAFLWLSGLLLVINSCKKYIARTVGWLLIPLGKRTLSAYCLQALLLCLITTFVPLGENRLINAAVALGSVLLIWGVLKINFVKKILPQ